MPRKKKKEWENESGDLKAGDGGRYCLVSIRRSFHIPVSITQKAISGSRPHVNDTWGASVSTRQRPARVSAATLQPPPPTKPNSGLCSSLSAAPGPLDPKRRSPSPPADDPSWNHPEGGGGSKGAGSLELQELWARFVSLTASPVVKAFGFFCLLKSYLCFYLFSFTCDEKKNQKGATDLGKRPPTLK